MKKLFFVLVSIFAAMTASAQFYAGGNIGLKVDHASSDGASATVTTFGIAPEVGYDINSTWAIGVTIPVQYQHTDGANVTQVGVLPYVRGTFASVDIVDFFGELALGYGHMSSGGYGVDGFESALRPGLKINFNEKFALVARTNLLSYGHYDGVNQVGFAINPGFDLGFKVSF